MNLQLNSKVFKKLKEIATCYMNNELEYTHVQYEYFILNTSKSKMTVWCIIPQ